MGIAETYNWTPGTTSCMYCGKEFKEGDEVTFSTPQHTACDAESWRRVDAKLCLKCNKDLDEEASTRFANIHLACENAPYEGYGV